MKKLVTQWQNYAGRYVWVSGITYHKYAGHSLPPQRAPYITPSQTPKKQSCYPSKMGSTIPLQWLCKIPFSQLPSFQWTVLRAGRFPLERQKKKSVEPPSREQCRTNSELSFGLGSTLSLQYNMIVQNTIFTTYFVPIDSFDSWTFPLGEAETKICWTE